MFDHACISADDANDCAGGAVGDGVGYSAASRLAPLACSLLALLVCADRWRWCCAGGFFPLLGCMPEY